MNNNLKVPSIGQMLTFVIQLFVWVTVLLLGFRIVLRLFGANPEAGFVQFVYENSAVVLEPFRGIFSVQRIDPDSVIDVPAIFAMLVYLIVGFFLTALVVSWRSRTEVAPARSRR